MVSLIQLKIITTTNVLKYLSLLTVFISNLVSLLQYFKNHLKIYFRILSDFSCNCINVNQRLHVITHTHIK